MSNYTIYHLHSDLSNAVTNIDSVTKFQEYVDAAKNCGMKALGFSEHGSVMEWWHKKQAIEAAGMKYLHGVECYLTSTLAEKVRDNYHCVLIAKNYEGFKELNRMISRSFDRSDNHFYYVPRISFEELFAASDNIIVTSACVGGVFGKGNNADKNAVLEFFKSNKDRCFLEIGHHIDDKQKRYNIELAAIAKANGIRLIAGTDTHVLNEEHERGRSILQKAKDIIFEGEEGWDLRFYDYGGLISAYQKQNNLDNTVYLEAIENTNLLADMVEEFKIDCGIKYPHIYDNPEETFRKKIDEARQKHPYLKVRYADAELDRRIEEELEVYKKVNSIDFMLLETYMREWEQTQGIKCGYGRGSVSGSMIAYILGITNMDSMKFNLNFFRFMNPARQSNADIDTDYTGEDRDKVKTFLLRDKMNLSNIHTAEIITFNTIAVKGAVRDVGRAMGISLDEVSAICEEIHDDEIPDDVRKKHAQLFEYVDIIKGTIVSVGTHPSGVLVSDLPIEELVGLCSVASSDYPVSMLNMKELDDQFYVKLDILGLDNIGCINKACEYLGIDRLDPDNTDLEDMDVWRSIRDDTTLIFQWESDGAQQYIKKFLSEPTIEKAKKQIPNFDMVNWVSFGNGLIRPSCASFRDDVANGVFYDNGFKELNEFLAPEAGRVAMQETIMKFLVKFCGYSDAESDNVRRAIAKKKGTESLLPEIEQRFVEYSSTHYDITEEKCREVIKPFIQIILDASSYSFSTNHSVSYTIIGYICGYLRYYHPLEFLTASLNIFADNTDKVADITKYADKVHIKITEPRFGKARGDYFYDRESNTISKGVGSVKGLSKAAADELYDLSQKKKYDCFIDLLLDIAAETACNLGQTDTLIKIGYFADFGNQRELQRIVEIFERFKRGKAKQVRKSDVAGTDLEEILSSLGTGVTKSGAESANWTGFDCAAVMRECERRIKEAAMPDLDDRTKLQNYIDAVGYAYASGENADRNKLYVTKVYPARRKADGKVFGYNIYYQSIGSGKTGSMTVFDRAYQKDPIKEKDLIRCLYYERKGKYFNLLEYEHIY